MKKTFIGYLLALIPLSSCSCLKTGTGGNVPEKEYQTIRVENDSLRSTRKWTSNYDDEQFPCDHGAYDGTIKGFDTDGKGRFNILGGDPVRLACFIRENIEWIRDLGLSMRHCQNALFKLVNDFVYFINEVKSVLYMVPERYMQKAIRDFRYANVMYQRRAISFLAERLISCFLVCEMKAFCVNEM